MVKVLVLGLDGLDFSMLPLLSSLPSNSIKLKLDSLIPLTFPSWASIMTGVNPGKHGIYGFFKYEKTESRWRARSVSAYDLEYPRIHEALALARLTRKSLIIGPMPPHPCLPCRNSDILCITQFSEFAYTSGEVLNKLYDVKKLTAAMESLRRPNLGRVLLDAALKIVEAHISALENLHSLKDRYDLLWLYVNLPDTYLHRCPQAFDKPNKLLTPLINKLNDLVRKALESSEDLVITSDHGFSKFKYAVRINRILYDHGLVKVGKGGIIDIYSDKAVTHRREVIRLHPRIIPYVHRALPAPLRRFLRSAVLVLRKLLHRQITISAPPRIDEHESKAFMPIGSSPAIIGNIVLLNDPKYARTVAKILRSYGLDAYVADELLSGPLTPKNLVFVLQKEDRLATSGTTYSDPIEEVPRVGHSRYGVLVAKLEGRSTPQNVLPDISPNTVVAPLVLSRLNAPLGVEMDSINLALKICGKEQSDVKYLKYRPMWIIYKKMLAFKEKSRGKTAFSRKN